jgi:hypothetical protein
VVVTGQDHLARWHQSADGNDDTLTVNPKLEKMSTPKRGIAGGLVQSNMVMTKQDMVRDMSPSEF